MIEIWKDITEFDGIYQISNKGRVRSYRAPNGVGPNRSIPRMIKTTLRPDNYYHVKLGKDTIRYVHRLLCEAFIDNPEEKLEVNHKDGNKSNNALENLEWCTKSENAQHAIQSGLRNSPKGPRHYMYGRKHSEQTRAKMRIAQQKRREQEKSKN